MTTCGLLTQSKKPVPLKSISVDVVVRGFVADVVSELQYQNEEKNPVEAVFVFPLDDEAAVYAFEGLIGGTHIEAKIQEKKQAEQEYEDALSEGRQTFLLGRERNTSDIFTCSLGNLPPDGEATLTLRYVQALAPEPDGAVRFVLPAVLNPRYKPQGSEGDTVTKNIPRVPQGKLPYKLTLSAKLESPYGIKHVESKCSLEPLHYTAEDRTTAQISLAEGHQFDRDVELLIYYENIHKSSALLEAGKPGAASGSLMGDLALLLTLYPSVPAAKPGQDATGEFIFLMDRSGSMSSLTDRSPDSPSRIESAKETLILLLKSLPLGCHFNIYGFGNHYESFYPQSVKYTQQTMSDSLKRVKCLNADLGGTEILRPLKAIYSQPCWEGHPRQLFVFTDGEVSNTNEVIAEVRRHSNSHRCFSFGIGEGASTALIKGIARAAGGSAEFITGKERMQAKALQSLKKALLPAVTKISLSWDLPSGLEVGLVGSGPQVIFSGHRCLIYAQIRGQQQSSGSTEGAAVLQYVFQDQTFTETMKFPLRAEERDRLPVHRLAAQALLQELEGATEQEEEKQRLALETSLSSGVVCSKTAYVGVNTELGKPVKGPLVHRDVPLAYLRGGGGINQGLLLGSTTAPIMHLHGSGGINQALRIRSCTTLSGQSPTGQHSAQGYSLMQQNSAQPQRMFQQSITDAAAYCLPMPLVEKQSSPMKESSSMKKSSPKKKESLLLNLVSLQNADGSWLLDSGLANILGLRETEISSKTPPQVSPDTWATVLAILWLHSHAAGQRDEWELLEAKALNWLRANAGPQLVECVKAGNALLGSSISPQALGL
ncbi:von Willebrand factor A domain-containing protein 5A isoform X2 [Elgaria multicarinata webbii]|uniref:von Willebrand factor A domain-containing protein 5A isoform X2 n=1 Tax=Elgaria multicarinata webbii TaxID=159646 RepID=UPI002FCCC60F